MLSRFVRRPRTRGQALVEFALILPIFLMLLFGLFDMGRAVYAWSTINNAAREAGRQLIIDQTFVMSGGQPVYTHARDVALNRSVALNVQANQVAIDFRDPDTLETADTCEIPDPTAIRLGCVAIVEIEYTFTPATPVIGQLVGTLTLRGESRFPVEAVCQEPTNPQCPPGD
jgi:TadE-like protein